MSNNQTLVTERVDDPVTRIHSRQSFFNLLNKRVSEAALDKRKLALLIIDINEFKRINHVYGYSSGDQLLQKFAALLEEARREQDHIARIGDSRFALILRDVINQGHIRLAALKILKLLEKPFELGESSLIPNVTIGIALRPVHASEPNDLLRVAEGALSAARSEQSLFEFASEADTDEISEYWDLEIELEESIEKEQLLVYYQPKISLATGKPVGAEALMRWNSPSRGFVSPAQFIPIAEQKGFIKPMTIWMLNTVLRQSRSWEQKWGPLSVSVNIAPQLLMQADFKDIIRGSLNLWPNDKVSLMLEIIERTLIGETEKCMALLTELRELGVKISIDDFGTGYSSLSYFKSIPADELKIDQSFIVDLKQNRDNVNIIKLIVHLAHSFKMHVVAEGVEQRDDLSVLAKLKCDQAQGFYIAKPMPAEKFQAWLQEYAGV